MNGSSQPKSDDQGLSVASGSALRIKRGPYGPIIWHGPHCYCDHVRLPEEGPCPVCDAWPRPKIMTAPSGARYVPDPGVPCPACAGSGKVIVYEHQEDQSFPCVQQCDQCSEPNNPVQMTPQKGKDHE